jgi:hypothetical protein
MRSDGRRQLDQDDEGLVHGRQGGHPQPAEPGGVQCLVSPGGRSAAADTGRVVSGYHCFRRRSPDYCATTSGKVVQWRENHVLSGAPPR